MSQNINLEEQAMSMLLATSRTFFIPISRLSPGVREAVASAYLCMRAIDEIEDHPNLPAEEKASLLRSISQILKRKDNGTELEALFHPYKSILPEVTIRMGDWLELSPETIVSNVGEATATMSDGMADWVLKDFKVQTEEDLDSYTFYVAGLVGLLLSEIWLWYDNIKTDRNLAVAFGRGLQAVNIIRNRAEDLSRGGVDFFPQGWGMDEMFAYARRNLAMADIYTESIIRGPIYDFCKIPLVLAHGTLNAMEAGEQKLSRTAVKDLVSQVTGEN
jgi:farnesyl-diphosphate farnesyltransferase